MILNNLTEQGPAMSEGNSILPTIEGVVFKTIDRFPHYVFGSNGSVWINNKGVWRPLSSHASASGKKNQKRYIRAVVSLRDVGSRRKNHALARLILEAFCGPCPQGMEACHTDGDSMNNRIENLRWDTHLNNMRDNVRLGVMRRGERHADSWLTPEDVRTIRRLRAEGYTLAALGKMYGTSRQGIWNICKRKNWGHVV